MISNRWIALHAHNPVDVKAIESPYARSPTTYRPTATCSSRRVLRSRCDPPHSAHIGGQFSMPGATLMRAATDGSSLLPMAVPAFADR
jgi:hypothetical protein